MFCCNSLKAEFSSLISPLFLGLKSRFVHINTLDSVPVISFQILSDIAQNKYNEEEVATNLA